MATDEIEMRVTEAVRSRRSFFRKQSDSLTFEGVRRLLEKDLSLDAFSLDSHKKLIKTLLQENFYSSEDDDAPGNVKENENEAENSELEGQNVVFDKHGKGGKEDEKLLEEEEQTESNIDIPDPREKSRTELGEVYKEINGKNEISPEVSETVIMEAVLKRASYLRAEIESITLGGFRRLLEQDLQLETKALDVHKLLISKLVDEILTSPSNEPDNVKDMNKKSQKKKLSKVKKIGSEEDEVKDTRTDTMEDSVESTKISRDDGLELKKEKLKASKSNKNNKEDLGIATLKGRKRKLDPEREHKMSVKKPKKKKPVEHKDAETPKSEFTKREEEESVDEIEEPVKNKASEDSYSASSDTEKDKIKRKNMSNTVVHSEQVQNLKKIIRSCGMGIPPRVYKNAKHQPDSKREEYLLQELTAILKKEGLSTNPTDKEIKAVVRRKEKAKDLEGIDMTNIISDSRRRRATSNFLIPPPQYKVSNEDDEESSDDEDSKSSEDDEPAIEEEESD